MPEEMDEIRKAWGDAENFMDEIDQQIELYNQLKDYSIDTLKEEFKESVFDLIDFYNEHVENGTGDIPRFIDDAKRLKNSLETFERVSLFERIDDFINEKSTISNLAKIGAMKPKDFLKSNMINLLYEMMKYWIFEHISHLNEETKLTEVAKLLHMPFEDFKNLMMFDLQMKVKTDILNGIAGMEDSKRQVQFADKFIEAFPFIPPQVVSQIVSNLPPVPPEVDLDKLDIQMYMPPEMVEDMKKKYEAEGYEQERSPEDVKQCPKCENYYTPKDDADECPFCAIRDKGTDMK
tara:strand:+ start:59 stop:934 length:876 start_codon:yes stop_codon:yes gene_type:complete